MIVYIYTFPNGKKYIGQTAQPLEKRAKKGEGYKNSPAVYNAIKKYGWENIDIQVFECNSKQEMNELEQYYIKLYKTDNRLYGYNLTKGGEGVIKYNREQVCELWNSGFGIGEIAKKLNCRHTTIHNILVSENLYNENEVNKRKIKQISKSSGEKLKEYYSNPEHQKDRINNGLKGAKKRSKEIVVFKDKECTQLVGVYPSCRQCAKELNIYHNIPSYAINHNHYGKGYYFYLKSDCDWYKIFGGK